MAATGLVFGSVGGVLKWWREHFKCEIDQWHTRLTETDFPLSYPSGPDHPMQRLQKADLTVDLLIEIERGTSDFEYYFLLLRDIVIHFGVPLRALISCPPLEIGNRLKSGRNHFLKIDEEAFSQRLDIAVDHYILLEDSRSEESQMLGAAGRVLLAYAYCTEELVFNFLRPGHNLKRKKISQLRKLSQSLNEKEKQHREEELHAQEVLKIHRAEMLKRKELRNLKLKALENKTNEGAPTVEIKKQVTDQTVGKLVGEEEKNGTHSLKEEKLDPEGIPDLI